MILHWIRLFRIPLYSLPDKTHLAMESCIHSRGPINQSPLIRQYLFPARCGRERLNVGASVPLVLWTTTDHVETAAIGCRVERGSTVFAGIRIAERCSRRTAGAASLRGWWSPCTSGTLAPTSAMLRARGKHLADSVDLVALRYGQGQKLKTMAQSVAISHQGAKLHGITRHGQQQFHGYNFPGFQRPG